MKVKYTINNIDIKIDNIYDICIEKKTFKQIYNDAVKRIEIENQKFYKNFKK